MNRHDTRALWLAAALDACPSLQPGASGWDELWLTLLETICTTGVAHVAPRGSSMAYRITSEYVGVELAAAMEFLTRHEATVREMPATQLYFRLRREATCGQNGSARAAQQDDLHGVTHVARGASVRFISFETWLGGGDDGLASAV